MANLPPSVYRALGNGRFDPTALTRGPWSPDFAHGGPGSALCARAMAAYAREHHGHSHVARVTTSLVRPVPVQGELVVHVEEVYCGSSVSHLQATLKSGSSGKLLVHATAAVQKELNADGGIVIPQKPPHHPLPPRSVEESAPTSFQQFHDPIAYHALVEMRQAAGTLGGGACSIWFRLRRPLVDDHDTGLESVAMMRALAFADSAQGMSCLPETFARFVFVNADLNRSFVASVCFGVDMC